jgi:ribosomal protein S18 acetylase RimI-like enzyme
VPVRIGHGLLFMEFKIREITREDVAEVIALLREFAKYENLLEFVEITEEKLFDAMFGENAFVEGLIALSGDRAVGYALYYASFATFRGQRGLYLEDIYISSEYRGRGLGETMLRQIARRARDRGLERIDFQVLEWNKAAIAFYEKLGAVRDEDERHFKFTDEAFGSLNRVKYSKIRRK